VPCLRVTTDARRVSCPFKKMLKEKLRMFTLLTIALFVALTSPAVVAQKKPKKKTVPRGTPVLWREQRIDSLDLFAGPGGENGGPDLSRLTLIKVEEKGWSPKFRVRDASGREWVAKLGSEAQSETVSVRLVWAAGYLTEINYLASCAHIPNAPTPKAKVERCEGDGFANVRFEARPKGLKRLDEWTWKSNPFVGTRQFEALKVMMALLNNWDLKDENNVIIYAPNGQKRDELHYIISDLGATFGKTGSGPLWRLKRSRNNPKDYAESKFVDKVKDGYVNFSFAGVNSKMLDHIKVTDARWIGQMLARLSDAQISDAFRAANYTPEETQTLTDALRRRINELVNLPEARRIAKQNR
jgi:hypothetical protein